VSFALVRIRLTLGRFGLLDQDISTGFDPIKNTAASAHDSPDVQHVTGRR